MTVYLLFNKDTAAERKMADFEAKLIEARVRVELVDADTPKGIAVAADYDLMARPAIALTTADGSLLDTWTEEDRFPSVQELSYRDRM